MRFHEWPPSGGQHSYFWDGDDSCTDTRPGAVLSADFRDGFAWDDMPDDCIGGCDPAQTAALAELCYEVGVAFEMDYGVYRSGACTSWAFWVLADYFRYGPFAEILPRSDPCDSYFDAIQREVDAARPMLYVVRTNDSGHALVCDGWRETGGEQQYHMNYGWANQGFTTWFAVDDTLPASSDPWRDYLIRGIEPGPTGWHDTYDLSEALGGTLSIGASDVSGVVNGVDVRVSNDEGATWVTFPMQQVGGSKTWNLPSAAAASVIQPHGEIWYYFIVHGGSGDRAHPWHINGPFAHLGDGPFYEFSILPIESSLSNPGILIVDKQGYRRSSMPRDGRVLLAHTAEYYYEEALGILGHEWERFDVALPSAGNGLSNGPDSTAFKYYDTQIWFTGGTRAHTLTARDQYRLVCWLNQASGGKERNLLIMGNDIGYDLVGCGHDTICFYECWLASEYVSDDFISVDFDSVAYLKECAGDHVFMDHDDGECTLRSWGSEGWCNPVSRFDVVARNLGIPGTETAVQYRRPDFTTFPAGVAYTHETMGYQTVNLGFGLESMRDQGMTDGLADRVNLMGNIMDYFGRTPAGPGTGVADSAPESKLAQAHPNPFGPATRIAYSVEEAGRVTMSVYAVSGRLVRVLFDADVDAGASGVVTWDGTSDSGTRCASGIYFYRLEAPGWMSSKKLVLLK
jgi:hypothetical protein